MSKMACRCGGTISDVLCPSPTEGMILRDQDQEAYFGQVCWDVVAFFAAVRAGQRREWIAENFPRGYPADLNDEDIVYDILYGRTLSLFLSIAECEQCGRLWVQREPEVNSYYSYAPDEPGYAAVLQSAGPNHKESSAAADLGSA